MRDRWAGLLARLAVVALAVTLMFAMSTATAPAGSHWSQKKCTRTFNRWLRHHPHATSKQISKYARSLVKKHKCKLG